MEGRGRTNFLPLPGSRRRIRDGLTPGQRSKQCPRAFDRRSAVFGPRGGGDALLRPPGRRWLPGRWGRGDGGVVSPSAVRRLALGRPDLAFDIPGMLTTLIFPETVTQPSTLPLVAMGLLSLAGSVLVGAHGRDQGAHKNPPRVRRSPGLGWAREESE